MKKNTYIFLIMLLAAMFASCDDNETLTPSDIDSLSRYEFPQGEENWDNIFDEIYQQHGTQLLYKDFTSKDLEKKWVEDNAFGDAKYIWRYYPEDGTDTLQVLSNYLRDKIFAYLNPEISKETFKPYIYLASGFQLASYFGEYVFYTNMPLLADGMDYWIFSLPPNVIYGKPLEANEKYIRTQIIAAYFRAAYERGALVMPAGFGNNVDYSTQLEIEDTTNENYFLNRGFTHYINLQASNEKDMRIPPEGYKAEQLSKLKNGADFINYITALIFDPDFNNTYKDYPLVLERASIVIDYMKEQYDIDLIAIAQSN